MRESGFWNYLKPKVDGRWSRIESPISAGVPDCYIRRGSNQWWVELKSLTGFNKFLGLSAVQVLWHQQHWQMGLTSFVCARINKQVIVVPGDQIDDQAGNNIWLARSIYTESVGKNLDGNVLTEAMQKIADGRLFMFEAGTKPKLSNVLRT